MSLFKILAIAALAMVSSASAQAGVALSNMGLDGMTYSNFDESQNQDANRRTAVGFTVGTSDFAVTKISAGLFASSVSQTMAIYSNVAGKPGSIVSTSLSTTVGTDDVYSFSFVGQSGNVLTAGQTYWAVLDTVGAGSSWYETTPNLAPSDVNSLGLLTYVGDLRSTNFGTTRTWANSPESRTFSISGTAVPPAAIPEPALTSLLCLSGIALIRRRMKK
jgi:hypothetical protein